MNSSAKRSTMVFPAHLFLAYINIDVNANSHETSTWTKQTKGDRNQSDYVGNELEVVGPHVPPSWNAVHDFIKLAISAREKKKRERKARLGFRWRWGLRFTAAEDVIAGLGRIGWGLPHDRLHLRLFAVVSLSLPATAHDSSLAVHSQNPVSATTHKTASDGPTFFLPLEAWKFSHWKIPTCCFYPFYFRVKCIFYFSLRFIYTIIFFLLYFPIIIARSWIKFWLGDFLKKSSFFSKISLFLLNCVYIENNN